jgi:hypothetical protein
VERIMPFTPFHFGPGLAIKSMAPEHFSLSVFVLANVLMDIEPLYRMWRVEMPLHGPSHTLAGAVLIGAGSALLAGLASRHGSMLLRRQIDRQDIELLSWRQAWSGGLLGTLTHLLLDAVMHADMQPFLPFTGDNPLLHPEWILHLHLFCLLAALVGMLVVLVRTALRQFRPIAKGGLRHE